MINSLLKQRGCLNTLSDHNEAVKLEMPKAWELLDSSQPLRTCEGSSSHGKFSNGNAVRHKGFCEAL